MSEHPDFPVWVMDVEERERIARDPNANPTLLGALASHNNDLDEMLAANPALLLADLLNLARRSPHAAIHNPVLRWMLAANQEILPDTRPRPPLTGPLHEGVLQMCSVPEAPGALLVHAADRISEPQEFLWLLANPNAPSFLVRQWQEHRWPPPAPLQYALIDAVQHHRHADPALGMDVKPRWSAPLHLPDVFELGRASTTIGQRWWNDITASLNSATKVGWILHEHLELMRRIDRRHEFTEVVRQHPGADADPYNGRGHADAGWRLPPPAYRHLVKVTRFPAVVGLLLAFGRTDLMPDVVLDRLARHPRSVVRGALAQNPRTPLHVRATLTRDADRRVATIAHQEAAC